MWGGDFLWDKTTHKKPCGYLVIQPLTRRKPCGYVGTWEVYKLVIDFNFWKKKKKTQNFVGTY